MEIGIYTLADLGPNPHTGKTISAHQRLKEIIQAAKMADELGLDVFGVGEHHRLDYAVSAPAIVLSAVSQVTKRIKLTTTTTVLNTIDPVRLFEDFATLDLLSNGRAEIIAGRGAFIESFPLFGYDVNQYDELFEEHIELFLKLNAEERVTWSGRFRSPLQAAEIAPRPLQKEIPIWVGVGGTPESAARAGRLGTGLALAILGGPPIRFKLLVDIYRQAASQAGHAPESLKVGVTGHAYISKTTEQAKDEYYAFHSNYWGYLNRQRGMSTHMSRADFEIMAAPETALFVGSSQQIIEKILYQYELFGHQRFIAQMDIGGMPFEKVAENIERLATEVAPVVRRETGKQ
ncbi:LLM class flavin-dependent oxidoreductase [Bacillus salipaludis]|uniref:LLM class flavin-dependent oxidoreductase n=1 Tax=Bacillus salipaludis TaxID=2547811 RepID=A0A4R5VQD2_9BACI|nr:LLM class flavin-dependent oxidoreductase [Bacillus salipaludis]MDQ6595808.1 LLM class flavin-dependent oxidoreductase [Bacillus salipaludis]TDK59854.1 LLM class flavin-dependent oxidoreductase [Bacillus salipaludis]